MPYRSYDVSVMAMIHVYLERRQYIIEYSGFQPDTQQ